jgi:hypothetical protein
MFVASAVLCSGLPEQMPAPINFQDNVEDYRSRQVMVVHMPRVFVSLLLAVNIPVCNLASPSPVVAIDRFPGIS